MKETVREFEKALRGSEELKKKLAEELARIAGEKSANNDAEALVKAARSLGFEFTVADMEKAHAEAQELDPEEMAKAAGGWCVADYDCCTAWNHDAPEQPGTSCFADYDCITAYHNSHFVNVFTDPETRKYAPMIELILKLINGGS